MNDKSLLLVMAIMLVCVSVMVGCAQLKGASAVKTKTTEIFYSYHSNSGIAISTSYYIYPDSLIWDYHEYRNDCHLRDVVIYNPQEFNQLIATLSQIKFSVKGTPDISSGGDGFSYAFFIEKDKYLYFDDTYQSSGDYDKLTTTIDQFISSHSTRAEKTFKRLSDSPHERGEFGEFMVLPQELEPYKEEK